MHQEIMLHLPQGYIKGLREELKTIEKLRESDSRTTEKYFAKRNGYFITVRRNNVHHTIAHIDGTIENGMVIYAILSTKMGAKELKDKGTRERAKENDYDLLYETLEQGIEFREVSPVLQDVHFIPYHLTNDGLPLRDIFYKLTKNKSHFKVGCTVGEPDDYNVSAFIGINPEVMSLYVIGTSEEDRPVDGTAIHFMGYKGQEYLLDISSHIDQKTLPAEIKKIIAEKQEKVQGFIKQEQEKAAADRGTWIDKIIDDGSIKTPGASVQAKRSLFFLLE